MNASSLIARIAAILSTLNGTDGGPESSLYLALGGDLSQWEQVRNAMIALGWIRCRGSWVTLTEAGKSQADKVDAILSK